MEEKVRISINSAFVSETQRTWTDDDKKEHPWYKVTLPKDIGQVNGTDLGGWSFFRKYCSINKDKPNEIVFTFPADYKIPVSLRVMNPEGTIAHYPEICVPVKDIADALDSAKARWKARQSAKAYSQEDEVHALLVANKAKRGLAQEPSPVPADEYLPDELRITDTDHIDLEPEELAEKMEGQIAWYKEHPEAAERDGVGAILAEYRSQQIRAPKQ